MKKLARLFVTLEIAQKLEELDFREFCLNYYLSDEKPKPYLHIDNEFDDDDAENEDFYFAPLYVQVIDWLREEHGIILDVEKCLSDGISWEYYYHIDVEYDTRIPIKGLRLATQSHLEKETNDDDKEIVGTIRGKKHYDEPYEPLEIGLTEALKLVEQLKKQEKL